MLPQLEAIPPPLRASEHLLVWEEITDKKGRKRKTPVSKSGFAIGYNNPDAIMSFDDVKSRLEKDDGIGFGISLLGGLNLVLTDCETRLEGWVVYLRPSPGAHETSHCLG